ncbi:MAG: winged helix-turn-helix transcriptional regulator [Tateyamaria sp.]|uniref:winged helix-turn-helix transcriptional regulator n=1 Tax=Tateyamaria sp. TaxID=1929288 RepID=UPI00327A05BE
MRPEFRLTPRGLEAAAIADKVQRVASKDDQDLLRKSWTLPVLTSLQAPSRFNDIKRNLRTITDRALSQSLKSMEVREWVHRRVDETARPPRSIYSAVNTGKLISGVAGPEISFVQH